MTGWCLRSVGRIALSFGGIPHDVLQGPVHSSVSVSVLALDRRRRGGGAVQDEMILGDRHGTCTQAHKHHLATVAMAHTKKNSRMLMAAHTHNTHNTHTHTHTPTTTATTATATTATTVTATTATHTRTREHARTHHRRHHDYYRHATTHLGVSHSTGKMSTGKRLFHVPRRNLCTHARNKHAHKCM